MVRYKIARCRRDSCDRREDRKWPRWLFNVSTWLFGSEDRRLVDRRAFAGVSCQYVNRYAAVETI